MLAQTSNTETAVVQPPVTFFTSTLHARTLRATLQLLGWLLLHPAAWRAYSTRVAPHLPTDFALSDLALRHLRSAELRRLLQIVYGLYPLLTMLVTALLLLCLQQPLVAVGLGMLFGAVTGWLGGVLVGATVSVPAGLASVVAGVVAGVGAGTGGLFAWDNSGALAANSGEAPGGLPAVTLAEIVGWTALGMIGSVAATTAPLSPRAPAATDEKQSGIGAHRTLAIQLARNLLWRRIGSLVVGAALGAGAIALLLLAEINGVAMIWLFNWLGAWLGMMSAVAVGLLFAFIVWGHTGRPLWGLLWGATLAILLCALTLLLERTTNITLLRGLLTAPADSAIHSLNGALVGVRVALLGGMGLSLLYVLGRRLSGEWGGAVGGALGTSGALAMVIHSTLAQRAVASAPVAFPGLSLSSSGTLPWDALGWAVLCACIGLTYPFWLPVLLYPMELLWNGFLFQIDKRRSATSRPFLPAHSVYWDEHQWLPLPSLAQYLILAVERNPWGGYHALAHTRDTHQRWAVHAAQLELDARWMLDCDGVEAIIRTADGVDALRLPPVVRPTVLRLQRATQGLIEALAEPSFYARRAQLHAIEEELDALLHQMALNGTRYVSRLRPVVTRWRQLVWEHDAALAASIEMRKALDSPYVVGLPLSMNHELFVGRTSLAAELAAAVRDSQTPIFLQGSRLSGKSSLLNNVGRLLPGDMIPLVIDVQGLVAQEESAENFFYTLARGMVNSARRHRSRTLPPLPREALATAPLVVFDEWLDDVEIELGDDVALLALDAYEVLDDAIAMAQFDADATMGTLWRAVQERPQFRLLVAGSRPLSQMEHWSHYLTHVQTLALGPLTAREAARLIEHPVPGFALRYEPDAVQQVLWLTGRHPALTQLLCHVIVALKNEGLPSSRGLATRQDVDHAAPVSLEMGEFFFEELTRTLSERGIEVARMLALRGTGANITHQELAKDFAFYLDEALLHLQRSGIIESLPENELAYRFRVELMRRWFAEWRKRENGG